MTGQARSMPIRDPETRDDSPHRTDYDAERGWWYPPVTSPEPAPSEDAQ